MADAVIQYAGPCSLLGSAADPAAACNRPRDTHALESTTRGPLCRYNPYVTTAACLQGIRRAQRYAYGERRRRQAGVSDQALQQGGLRQERQRDVSAARRVREEPPQRAAQGIGCQRRAHCIARCHSGCVHSIQILHLRPGKARELPGRRQAQNTLGPGQNHTRRCMHLALYEVVATGGHTCTYADQQTCTAWGG